MKRFREITKQKIFFHYIIGSEYHEKINDYAVENLEILTYHRKKEKIYLVSSSPMKIASSIE